MHPCHCCVHLGWHGNVCRIDKDVDAPQVLCTASAMACTARRLPVAKLKLARRSRQFCGCLAPGIIVHPQQRRRLRGHSPCDGYAQACQRQ